MRAALAAFFIASAYMGLVHHVNAQNLPPLGELPEVGKQWQLRTQGNAFAFHWVVLTNAETSDILSFASYKLQLKPGQKQDLIYLSDTAHEIFPGGDPVWPLPSAHGFSVFPIRNEVVKLEFRDRTGRRDQEALQYTFIRVDERKHGTNQMAHGYAVVFDDVAVFVQHTSKKPITFDLACDTATKLLESHYRRRPAPKPEAKSVP
jgi:hypothetical protein